MYPESILGALGDVRAALRSAPVRFEERARGGGARPSAPRCFRRPGRRHPDRQHQRIVQLAVQASVRPRRNGPRPGSQLPLVRAADPTRGGSGCLIDSNTTAAGPSTWTPSAAPPSTRAIIVVSPNNPTGSFVSSPEFDEIQAVCRDRSWALIVDEVFADYTPARNRGAAQRPRRPSRRPFVWRRVQDAGPAAGKAWLDDCRRPAGREARDAARPRTRCRRVPVGEHTRSGCGVSFAGRRRRCARCDPPTRSREPQSGACHRASISVM